MGNQEWDDLGNKIQDIIDNAVSEKNFRRMSQEINYVINRAIDSGSGVLKDTLEGVFGQDKEKGRYKSNPDSGPIKGKWEDQGDYGEYTYGMPGEGRWDDKRGELGGAGSGFKRNPERHARAYETHKNHGYQKPPFGRAQGFGREQEKQLPSLYAATGWEKAKGVLMTTFGGLFTGVTCTGLVAAGIFTAGGVGGMGMLIGTGIVTAASALLLRSGCVTLGRLARFKNYTKALGERTYCNLDQLSKVVGKPVKFVKKDLKTMIQRGWFLEGRLDQQETCLITSKETYQQYEETRRQLMEREKEMAKAKEKKPENVSPEVQEVLDKGNEYLEKIRLSNDAIPGEVISRKISRMELIVEKIFERAREHQEIIPDLKKLMDYYLPMTVKLLAAYEDMDRQPVQGENIQNSKKEIEDTIDTLNIAFEKLLDSVFADTALDVSSDISVLHTILAQEGLTEDDFEKMKKEARKS